MDCNLHNHNQNEKKIIENIPDNKSLEKISEIFQLLSDPTRLKILWMLCHCEFCVNNIACLINMSAPAVSHHLKLLKQADLISSRRNGKEIYYTLSDSLESQLVHKAIDDILNIKCPK